MDPDELADGGAASLDLLTDLLVLQDHQRSGGWSVPPHLKLLWWHQRFLGAYLMFDV